MASKTEQRREELRESLLEIAEREIRAHGLSGLRARALAEEAGCSVGAIYNVFDDMTGLLLAVNGRTFHRLGAHVSGAVEKKADTDPTETLITMAVAYMRFASKEPNLWRALFNIRMTTDQNVPTWYLDELTRLFAIIAAPLARLYPKDTPARIDLKTRTLFSSVHGIVLLGLENRISGVPQARIEEMIGYLLRNATSQS